MNCVRAAWLGLLTGALACSPAHAIYNMSAFYSPSAWRPLPTTDAPSPRFGHVAVWSGTYFVVWGGRDPVGPTVHNDGARFATTAVWDEGTDMIVWGGLDSSGSAKLNTGAKYNVGTNTWNAVTTTSAPTARDGHAAVFCDGKMVIWGGTDTTSVAVNTGGLYDISLGTWTATGRA
ncbi:MAG TPA: kelch repeat-containing protein [Bdellovibrionales bacterium]|nr:kelch repeat-containing protein [Bdellovibrionales bacterium]